MLINFIRKHTKLLFICILSLVLVPFLFWGIGSVGRQAIKEGAKDLRLYGKAISPARLNQARMDAQILLLIDFVEGNHIQSPEQFNQYKDWFARIMDQVDINTIAVQQIILQREAALYGITITKDDLTQWIKNFSLFRNQGIFNAAIYNNIVKGYFHTWPAKFEKALTRVLETKQLMQVVMDSLPLSPEEVLAAYQERNEKVTVYYVDFNPASYIKEVPDIDESEAENYYNKHREEFREPEKIRISYLLFDPADYREETVVEQKEIEDYYQSNQDKFTDEEEKIKPLAVVKKDIVETLSAEKAENRCREQALEISIQLTDEKRINDMIRLAVMKNLVIKETDYLPENQPFIPGLGWVPEVMKHSWQMEPDSISDLLKAGDKWVIISPIERKPSAIAEFSGVKQKIVTKLKRESAAKLARQRAQETFSSLPPDLSFTMALRSLGLHPRKSDPITRTDKLFCLRTEILETPEGAALVSRREFYPIDETKWEGEKDAFTETYRQEKRGKFMRQWLNNLTTRALSTN